MRFADTTQNLRARLRVVQVLIFALLAALGARLYYLQVVNGAYYAEKAENQRVRRLPIPAQRGTIFDRNGKILVDSRPTYNVILSREEMKGGDFAAFADQLAAGLGVDEGLLRARLEAMSAQPAFESSVVKQDASTGDIAWVEARAVAIPGLHVEQQPQWRYPSNGTLAHVLGYVGEISPKQLETDDAKKKGLKPGAIIGQEGLEKVYDEQLRGRDGYREVIVDSKAGFRTSCRASSRSPDRI